MRVLARAERWLQRITRQGKTLVPRTDAQLRDLASGLQARARLGESLDDLLVETYALVREVAARTVGLRPFDVQILGAIALHGGNLVEMKTGEGKTLAATLPVVLNALTGSGVHLVTVNDYLAARDAEWMGPIYRFMGLSVGVVTEDLDSEEQVEARKLAYAADITYVTNHELVFDYLRDNLAMTLDEKVLRPLHYAVVDEVDLLLLDEARTPLIISGPTGDDPGRCVEARNLVAGLKEGKHYQVDHKSRQVLVQEDGWATLEQALGVANLADSEHIGWQHVLHNAMLAHAVYQRDVDYIVDGDQVYIVDEFTGRVSPDKRFADGLHQALEAKEGVEARSEDQTLAKTSYQTFFSLYPRLCGMTGTAASVREEFARTYGLKVVVVPTHRPAIRRDLTPAVYLTTAEKFSAVTDEIQRLSILGRPVLVGTTSVKESEQLSAQLAAREIQHNVLNAKNHHDEAEVIAQAGRPGAVTISTNMAGRGVDILLGGNPDASIAAIEPPPGSEEIEVIVQKHAHDRDRVIASGGLAVVGTGLHESKRIDDQLRGRAGRQGDPGTSRYFLSLNDPIYRKFGEARPNSRILDEFRRRLKRHPRGEQIRDASVLAALEELRKKVEVENEEARKEVLKYDLVIEQQRKTIYSWRLRLLGADLREAGNAVLELVEEIAEDLIYRNFAGETQIDRRLYENFADEVAVRFGIDFDLDALGAKGERSPEKAGALALEKIKARVTEVRAILGHEAFAEAGRQLLLSIIDDRWTDHLGTLERLDEAIGLRGYAQLDPLVEFRREANILYQDMFREIRLCAISALGTLTNNHCCRG
jgi:preprotein translocase subunit SecA